MGERKFKITISGKSYEVLVEEMFEDEEGILPKASAAKPEKSTDSGVTIKETKKTIELEQQVAIKKEDTAGKNVIKAPIAGEVISVKVQEGQTVNKGDVLILLEAMKMENEIYAPISATVEKIYVNQGASIESGTIIMVLK